ncbi:MAG: hypothetical protein AB4352_18875 [Hormoscilla sp.]
MLGEDCDLQQLQNQGYSVLPINAIDPDLRLSQYTKSMPTGVNQYFGSTAKLPLNEIVLTSD